MNRLIPIPHSTVQNHIRTFNSACCI